MGRFENDLKSGGIMDNKEEIAKEMEDEVVSMMLLNLLRFSELINSRQYRQLLGEMLTMSAGLTIFIAGKENQHEKVAEYIASGIKQYVETARSMLSQVDKDTLWN